MSVRITDSKSINLLQTAVSDVIPDVIPFAFCRRITEGKAQE
jgi:hypothetical protein